MFPEGRALEFLIAGVIALIVVGPKDLPILMRKLGKFMGKMRSMAAEFRASFDEMARQSELEELRREVEAMRQAQLADVAQGAHTEVQESLADIRQTLSGVGADLATSSAPPYDMAPATEGAPSETAAPKPRAKTARSAGAKPKAAAKPRARRKPSEPQA